MGNSASLNDTINAKLSQIESIDINFTKPFSKNPSNVSNKCAACQASFNFISFKKRKCVNCMENYCLECVTHYKDNIYICYRCQIFISPDFGWSELMKLKSKDLVWYLHRKNISCSDCKEKEQLVEVILERFKLSSDINTNRDNQMPSNSVNLINNYVDAGQSSSFPTEDTGDGVPADIEIGGDVISDFDLRAPSTSDQCIRKTPPPSYEKVMEGGYSSSPNARNERVPIEDITNLVDIELLSVKQLKDMLAYNKVDYKGCVERHELISRVERLWTAYNSDRNDLMIENSEKPTSVKECVICMDKPVDCVLIECGHMLCCVRCGSRLAECPICRQNVVRCIRVFAAH